LRSAGALLLAVAVAGCQGDVLTLRYHLEGIDPATVAAVQTTIAPLAPERFLAPAAEVQLDDETRYRVSCAVPDDQGCAASPLLMVIDHLPTPGGRLPPIFTLQFRAGPGTPSRLLVSAIAPGADGKSVGRSLPTETGFGGVTLDLYLRDKSACGAITCTDTQACCGGACIDVEKDGNNCGDCNVRCGAGEACVAGECSCAGGAACSAGRTCCSAPPTSGCVDTGTDPQACGACGNVCAVGEQCTMNATGAGACSCGAGAPCTAAQRCCGDSGGCVAATDVCTCGGTACAATDICCGTSCADVLADPNHCGGCDRVCPAGPSSSVTCVGGQCRCGDEPCAGTCCGTTCADVTSDVANCGTCGNACRMGEVCQGGKCSCGGSGAPACGTGQVCCGAGLCVDTLSDGNHCGDCVTVCGAGTSCIKGQCQSAGCGSACTDAGNTCTAGNCACGGQAACIAPAYCCPSGNAGAACTSLTTTSNCGSCGQACGSGEDCTNGACSCVGGAACGPAHTCCSVGCRNLNTAQLNCGACGVRCGVGEICMGGQCTCGGKSNAHAAGAVCAAGEFCDAGTCTAISVAACPTGADYMTGKMCDSTQKVCCGYCAAPAPLFYCALDAMHCDPSCPKAF
jgi:hypothetical protein